MQNVNIPSAEDQRSMFKELLEEYKKELLEEFQKMTQNPYLSTKDLKERFGISYTKQQYMRDEQKIGYIQDGKKILYPVEEFEKWAKAHSFNME